MNKYRATKAHSILLDLRAKILGGEIGPEARLTLRPLASAYGTGINAVSEAVKALAAEGLVDLEGKAGARVIARDLRQIRGEYILRIAIECEAARRCAEVADESQLALLESVATRLDQLFEEEGRLSKGRELDVQFHLMVAEFTGVLQLRNALVPLIHRLVGLNLTHSPVGEFPGQRHLEVLSGIRSRDPDRASAIMRLHCEHSMNFSLAALCK